MAKTTRLVSTTHLTIVGGLCALAAVSVFVLRAASSPYYNINDAALDGAVVNGITSLERSSRTLDTPKSRIVVVPHHLVAHEVIAEGIARIAKTQPHARRFIVLSPDHYKRCPEFACTSYGSFETFFGDIPIDAPSVQRLLTSGVFAQSDLFSKEHGVYSIVPFIRHYVPEARIIPVVVSIDESAQSAKRIALASILESLLLDTRVVLVLSTDFSHYLPLLDAQMMDLDTQTALCARRLEYIKRFRNPEQSDCPTCLWLATTLAAGHETPHPYFFAHTNSATLLNEPSVAETTSHFGIIYAPEPDTVSCRESL
jgi:AmmeMemoRadiSam system protein B